MSESRAKPLRLFIGVRVSMATVSALNEAVQAMRGAVGDRLRLRWIAPASYHITLAFLGWARPEVTFALRDRVAGALAGQRAFELETMGLGGFPSPVRARVLWAGMDEAGSARLTELAQRIAAAAEELGFAREERAFHAHVTLARLPVPGDIRSAIQGVSEQKFRHTWVDSAILFQSHMKSTGSEYEEKARWNLEDDSKPSRRHRGPVETESELESDAAFEEPSGDESGPEGAAELDGEPAEEEEQRDDGDQL